MKKGQTIKRLIDRLQIERRITDVLGGDWKDVPIFVFDFEEKVDGSVASWSRHVQDSPLSTWRFSDPAVWRKVVSPTGHLMLPYDRFVVYDPDNSCGCNVIKIVERIAPLEIQLSMIANDEVWLSAQLECDPQEKFLKQAAKVKRIEAGRNTPDIGTTLSDEIAITFLFLLVVYNPEVQRLEKYRKKRDKVTKEFRESNKFEILVDRRSTVKRVKTLHVDEVYDPETVGSSYAIGSTSQTAGTRIGHRREEHPRTLRSAYFRHKQGQVITIPESWIGPREWRGSGGYTYRVLLKDRRQIGWDMQGGGRPEKSSVTQRPATDFLSESQLATLHVLEGTPTAMVSSNLA